MTSLLSRLVFFICCCLLIGCESQQTDDSIQQPDTTFTLMNAEDTQIDFVNQVEGNADFNVLTYRNFYNGGGVAIGDLNGDQLPDIYFTANEGANKLYLNRGNWTFEEVGEQASVAGTKNWSTGVAFADVNGDGLLDMYVCNSGDIEGANKTNELFINLGVTNPGDIPRFVEQSERFGLNDPGFSTHASFFDYDLDGDLDCYLLNNSFKDPSRIDLYTKTREEPDPLGGDKLFRNDGTHFTDVTLEAGIYNSQIGFGLGVSVSDLNGDNWPDIYVSNDFWERDYLYLNLQNGTFSEVLTERIPHTSVSSMGSDIADINNDGAVEIFSTDMLPADNYRLKTMTVFDPFHLEDAKYRSDYHYQILQNCLQLNRGDGHFQEIGFLANVAATDWSWGAMIFDFDNDGWKDIYVANGIYHDIMYRDFSSFISDEMNVKRIVSEKGRFDFRDFLPNLPSTPLANYAFVNQKNLHFDNQADALGLSAPSFSNGAAYGDLDQDGDYDLVVNNVNMPCFVYQNTASSQPNHNSLKIDFQGDTANAFGVGATVKVVTDSLTQTYHHYPNRGFQSSMEPGLLIGLGEASIVDTLLITWPDGNTQLFTNLPSNKPLKVFYSDAGPGGHETQPASPMFTQVNPFGGKAVHRENAFNDFDSERLLPHMLSTEGPRLLSADVNGDKLEDVVLLGSKGQADQLWLQETDGTFTNRPTPGFQEDAAFESTCGTFFDADQDGDQDLILGSGGNDISLGMDAYRLRFYENDGTGMFISAPQYLPAAGGQISCIEATDFDQDGDIDLFIGGRSVPGNYGLPPASFFFRKDGETWTQLTTEKMGRLGMVTDATWADVDGDQLLDLIVVGEWMPVTVFKNLGNQLSDPLFVPGSEGWWTRIEAADLDRDGKTDFVLGNWGDNQKFSASSDKPLSLFVKDFDGNGKSEFILNWYPNRESEAYPFADKTDLQSQLPVLKKRALKFEEFAHLTYETMFSDVERSTAIPYRSNHLRTSILWQGENGFTLQALPAEAQMAPTFGISVTDINEDEFPDIILGGNFHGLKPEVGRFDSHRGILLLGSSNRTFTPLSFANSGIWWEGEVRDLTWIQGANDFPTLLVTRNNQSILAYRYAKP